MWSKSKIGLVVVLVMASIWAKAEAAFQVHIASESTIHVVLRQITKGQKLRLKSYSGNMIYHITLDARSDYSKYFSFRSMTDGVYFVETETEYDVKITPVVKNKKGIALLKSSLITVFKPRVELDKAVLKLQLLNDRKDAVSIRISNSETELVYQEAITAEELIVKRAYQLDMLPKGEYTIHFALRDRTFRQRFKI